MSFTKVGSLREMFVDEYLIEKYEGQGKLRMHSPHRAEVVFEFNGPMENACSSVYSTVFKVEDHYRLYYRGHYPIGSVCGDAAQQQTAHVAISADGINFERPTLKNYDFGDSGCGNVVWQGIQGHNFVPFLDQNPKCFDESRYKAVGGTGKNNLYSLNSKDGFSWSLTQKEPLSIPGKFDSANLAFFDRIIGKYRLFSRFSEKGRGRAIQSSFSKDFVNWTEPVPNSYEAGLPKEEFYTNATVAVPGAEHTLLSFPMRYVAERTTPLDDISQMDYPGIGQKGMEGMTDAVVMSSRDGINWYRPFCEAWLRPGLDDRNWTHRNTTPAIGILQTNDSEWSMYVSEHYGWSDNRLRRLSLRPWGFASIYADYRGGGILTKPIVFDGSELRINFSTSAIGSVRIEIQDAHGMPFPGYTFDEMDPIFGDQLDRRVNWIHQRNLSELSGLEIKLRFELCDADVFSFRFV